MRQLRTYGKRKHLLPPKQDFIDDEQTRNSQPLLGDSSQKRTNRDDPAEDELLASPVPSDNSSSIKSIEPAMERRVSLLLRGGLPIGEAKTIHSSVNVLDSSPFREQMTPGRPVSAVFKDKSSRDKDPNSTRMAANVTPDLATGNLPQNTSAAANRASTFNKRISAIWSRQPNFQLSSEDSTLSRPKGREKNTSRAPGSLISGFGAGRRILERAKSAVTKSPSKGTRARRDKTKERRGYTEKDELLINVPEFSPTKGVYSPSSLFFDAPDIEVEPWVPTEKTRVPSRPQADTFASVATDNKIGINDGSPFLDSTSPPLIRVMEAEPDSPSLVATCVPQNVTRKYTEDNQKLTVTDSLRLSVLEPTVSASPSTGDTDSVNFGLISNPRPEHKLRHMTAKIKRRSVLSSHSSNSTMNASKQCRSTNEILSPGDRLQNLSVEASEKPSKANKSNRQRKPLGEADPNKMMHSADEGTIKLAKAIRVSVSPKVREVFNKFPKKTATTLKPANIRATDEILSRSSSKASHVLGHHVGSREPLRPPRGDQDMTLSFREDLSSEDELAM